VIDLRSLKRETLWILGNPESLAVIRTLLELCRLPGALWGCLSYETEVTIFGALAIDCTTNDLRYWSYQQFSRSTRLNEIFWQSLSTLRKNPESCHLILFFRQRRTNRRVVADVMWQTQDVQILFSRRFQHSGRQPHVAEVRVVGWTIKPLRSIEMGDRRYVFIWKNKISQLWHIIVVPEDFINWRNALEVSCSPGFAFLAPYRVDLLIQSSVFLSCLNHD